MNNALDPRPSIHDASVTAILLAAGRSSRMGTFKPLLPFGQQTIIESCIDYLSEGGADSVIVVLGHRGDEIRKQLQTQPVRFAVNPNPKSEMGASIIAGVQALPATTRAVLIALVDYPAIPSSVVSALIQEWAKGFRLVKPMWRGQGGHPVLVDIGFRDELLNVDSKRGLKGLFDKHLDQVKRVEVDSPFVARDLDTWDDYTSLYKEIFSEPAPELPKDYSNEKTGGLI